MDVMHAKLQMLYDDSDWPDTEIADEDDLKASAPRVITRVYEYVLRTPARPVFQRWPVMTGFLVGAPTDTIADGLAAGQTWRVGPAPLAAGATAIWLLDLAIPYRDQIAAWRANPIRQIL